MTRVTVFGDALLDRDVTGSVERVCPDAPVPVLDEAAEQLRPGGAALAADLLAADGLEVVLVTALGDDEAGATVRDALAARGVDVVDLRLAGRTPEKVRLRAGGQSLLRLDRGGTVGNAGPLTDRAREALTGSDAVLVADYGRGLSTVAEARAALCDAARRVPLVWDPHPRGAAPVPAARLVTPSEPESRRFAPAVGAGVTITEVTARAQAMLRAWEAHGVAVTLGARGALLARSGAAVLAVPVPYVAEGDTCGAGDRFAGAATAALATGAILPEAVETAVEAASAFVAAGGAATRQARDGEAPAGPTVVATGGCFDLLHAGHVAMLQAARRLGDRLVVLLNADASVRRLKGPGRPLQSAADRRAVLLALGCVDDVVIFDEDTPVRALEHLRPSIFVKGADYAVDDLPEAPVMARWGGQAVVVPYLDGRSTSRLVQEVMTRGR